MVHGKAYLDRLLSVNIYLPCKYLIYILFKLPSSQIFTKIKEKKIYSYNKFKLTVFKN